MTRGNNTEEEPLPPRWAVWVARAVAVVVVVPVRLVWEGLKAVGRAVHRFVLRPLSGVLRRIWTSVTALTRFLWRRVVVPIGTGLRRVFGVLGAGLRGGGGLLMRYLLRPTGALLRALASLVGRGLGALADGLRRGFRALTRFALRPAGRGLRRLFGPVGRGLRAAAVAVAGFLRRAVASTRRLLRVVLLNPVVWCWRTLVVKPLRWLWRNVAVPTGRAIGAGLWWLVRLFAAALVWAFRRVGRVLAVLGRAVRDAFVRAGRRVALPLWRLLASAFRALVVIPVRWAYRTLVVTPAKWVHRAVLAPAGRLTRQVWRVAVVAPLRLVRTSMVEPVRLAGRRVRGQLRNAFGNRRS
ncbi:hypothetical protein [Saccharothrix deserti]|uniref:hypothetical protein n=1 Tax=Saccharothrix deserti TaxID=2593674 RepID=UPI00131AA7F7|nr:hypothetical protein [Saccharothrix deserti]